MSTEYRITPTAVSWKLPFNLALLLHVLIISSAIYFPQYFNKRSVLPEFYTVDLVNIAEPLPSTGPAIPPPPQIKPSTEVDKPDISQNPEAVAIEPPPAAAPVESVKPISIKPLKRKLKKKIPPDTSARDARKKREAEQRRQQQLLEARRQQLLQEAQRQQAIADAEAKAAANEALNALKQSLRADAVANSARNNQGPAASRGRGTSNSLEAQYFSTIFSHLHQYWSLPDIKPWSPDTTAIVVVTISKNGTIIDHDFERYSGDKVFDRFVSRTIQDANPLPAIPPALKKNQYTIGFRFRPGGIQ